MKLLIADDQQSLHTYLLKMIKWEEFGITEIQHAYDGKQTLRMVRENAPHLVILDIRMPFMSGLEMLKQLHDLPRKPKTIILSAHDEFEYARDALHLNVAQYLLKPVDPHLLNKAVTALLGEVRQEYRQSLTREFGNLVHSRSFHPDTVELFRAAFAALQIDRYLLLDVCGDFPSGNLPTEAFAGLIPDTEVICYRKSPDGYVCFMGLSSRWKEAKPLEMARKIWEQWTESCPNARLSAGVSRVAEEPEEILHLLKQSEEANAMHFYSLEPVNAFAEGYFERDWPISEFQRYEKEFVEKTSFAFHTEALVQLVRELFGDFRRKRMHPDYVYTLISQCLRQIGQTPPASDSIGAEPQPGSPDFLRSFRNVDDLEAMFVSRIRRMEKQQDSALGLDETMLKIKQYIDLHYGEDLSLQTVARLFSIDRFQLSRLFKQQFHVNYWSYVMQVRMEKAAEMLTGTALKNSAIAAATGFVDESHFSRAFKNYFKMTPKEYRQSRGKRSP